MSARGRLSGAAKTLAAGSPDILQRSARRRLRIDYICGVQVSECPAHPAEFARLRIPPQSYAVFEHPGHVSAISATWHAVWNHALSTAGLEATDGPAFERYDARFDPRTGSGGFEIWVPVSAESLTVRT